MGFRRCTVRGILAQGIVFLLLGAIINIAVAWAFCLPFHWFIEFMEAEMSKPTGEQIRAFGHSETDMLWLEHGASMSNYEYMGLSCVFLSYGSGWTYLDTRMSAGFPMRALTGFRRGESLSLPKDVYIDSLIEPNLPYFGQRRMPLRPLWPGFAIDTIFYAGICWLLFAAPFAVRRRRRIKRGLCPACAYPVGTNTVCTECGRPVAALLGGAVTPKNVDPLT